MPNTYTKGKGVIIKAKNETGEFVPVLGQTGGSISREIETIEVYSKDDTNKQIYGSFEAWSVSLEGLYVLSDTGMDLIEKHFTEKTNVELEIALEDAVFTGQGLITSMELDLGMDDMVTYSMEIQGSGQLTRADNGA